MGTEHSTRHRGASSAHGIDVRILDTVEGENSTDTKGGGDIFYKRGDGHEATHSSLSTSSGYQSHSTSSIRPPGDKGGDSAGMHAGGHRRSKFAASSLLCSVKGRRQGVKVGSRKGGSCGEYDEIGCDGPSSVDIRNEHLKQLADERPKLSDKQMALILSTWAILQRDTASVGLEMFTR